MAKSLNLVILHGNCGRDPETKDVNGRPFASFNLATTMNWGKGNDKKEETTWHKCVAWGNVANIVNSIVRKGEKYLVQGRLSIRKWHDEQSGIDKYFPEIVINEIISGGNKPQGVPQAAPQAPVQQQEAFTPPPLDDLPF